VSLCRAGREDVFCCNLLVATDVAQEGLDMPSCNFVVRYNFVSNEIGSVQSKGRARAPHSECYLIVERGSSEETREYANLKCERRMMEALWLFDAMPYDELRKKIAAQRVSLVLFMVGVLAVNSLCLINVAQLVVGWVTVYREV